MDVCDFIFWFCFDSLFTDFLLCLFGGFWFVFVFLGPHLWHMEVPRLGVELEL